jgi:hypothetical protein
MLIWIPITIIGLVIVGWFLSRRSSNEIPVFINGLIPSLPDAKDKSENGTTVYIVYLDNDKEEIFRGYADENGSIEKYVSRENVGRRVLIRARHAAYKFDEFEMTVPEHGITHTVKMVKDGLYNGDIRGKNVDDLDKYYEEALEFANTARMRFMRNADSINIHPFARIPVWFWLLSYAFLIVGFAGDYWLLEEGFNKYWDTFVHAVYFSAVTITTLGYGDNYPTSDLLRLCASGEAVLGIFIVGFALNSLFYGPQK